MQVAKQNEKEKEKERDEADETNGRSDVCFCFRHLLGFIWSRLSPDRHLIPR